MAQPNHGMNPVIHFNHIHEDGYISQTPQFAQDFFSQWDFSDSGTTAQSNSSPTNTVNGMPVVPVSRTVPHINAKRRHQQPQYDPSLPFLMPPRPRHQVLTRNADQIVDPITRMYRSDEPWNPVQMRSSNVSASHNAAQYGQEDYSQYGQRSRSDIDIASDSGYQTQTARSVLSNEPDHGGQELPLDFMLQTENMNVGVAPQTSHTMARTASDQRSVSQHSSRSGGRRQHFPCNEPGCLVISKCPSEKKRHMLKHEKRFVCNERDCKRAGKGFSTVNDLERHKKSVHKIGIEKSKSYQCASASCANKTKIWPRLDNFKQHLERMHADEDKLDLIQRSEMYCQDTPSLQQPFSLDPALIVGVGDHNDDLSSSPSHPFPYQPSMSFHTSSFSSGSQISPTTAPPDRSFPPSSASSSSHFRSELAASDHCTASSVDRSMTSRKRRKLTSTSSTDTSSTVQATPSFTCGSDTASSLQLSNDPQTKSEQQRQALAKLSNAMHDQVNMRESNESQGDVSCILSEDERRVLAELLKERSMPARLPQRRSTQGSTSSVHHCDFDNCGFSGRLCDLKKHRKRHVKPYGCTYPQCFKRFGAKSDWKRHEQSQHFQLEAYRCNYRNNAGRHCGYHCHRPLQFQKHLTDTHKIASKEQVESRLKHCKIGKNCQGQYWCGFCREIQVLEKKRNDAWDERFNHIASHIEKQKMSISDWLCAEENRSKKESRDGAWSDELADATELDLHDSNNASDDGSLLTGPHQVTTQKTPGTRRVMDESVQPRSSIGMHTSTILQHCCQCKDGPSTYRLQLDCLNCPHRFCDDCPLSLADDNEA